MSNWYAYKVMADTYRDERFATAARDGQARRAARSKRGAADHSRRARHESAASAASPSGSVTSVGRWSWLFARRRLRRPSPALAGAPRPTGDLHPSVPC